MKLLSLIVALFIYSGAYAQTQVVPPQSVHSDSLATASEVFKFAEEMPSPGYNMMKYLQENIQYPDSARIKKIQGRIIIEFVVNENGSISDVKVARGIGKECDNEAVRIIKSMPPWNPGKQNGKPVRVMYNQPITFKMDTTNEFEGAENNIVSADSTIYNVSELDVTPQPAFDTMEHFSVNLRYPERAKVAGIQGKVVVEFVINKDGSMSDLKIIKHLGGGCDEEVIRLMNSLPKWKPGKRNGIPVKSLHIQSISFTLIEE